MGRTKKKRPLTPEVRGGVLSGPIADLLNDIHKMKTGKKLSELTCRNAGLDVDDLRVLFQKLHGIPAADFAVRSLDLSGNCFGDAGLNYVLANLSLKRISSLDMRNCGITPQGLAAGLSTCEINCSVTHIRLEEKKPFPPDLIARMEGILQQNRELWRAVSGEGEAVDLSDRGWSSTAVLCAELREVQRETGERQIASVTTLVLACNHLSECPILTMRFFPNLRHLDLSRNSLCAWDIFGGPSLGDDDDEPLLPHLESLDLSHNLIRRFPAGLEDVVSLQVLRLNNNEMECIPVLALITLPNLRDLAVHGNPLTNYPPGPHNTLYGEELVTSLRQLLKANLSLGALSWAPLAPLPTVSPLMEGGSVIVLGPSGTRQRVFRGLSTWTETEEGTRGAGLLRPEGGEGGESPPSPQSYGLWTQGSFCEVHPSIARGSTVERRGDDEESSEVTRRGVTAVAHSELSRRRTSLGLIRRMSFGGSSRRRRRRRRIRSTHTPAYRASNEERGEEAGKRRVFLRTRCSMEDDSTAVLLCRFPDGEICKAPPPVHEPLIRLGFGQAAVFVVGVRLHVDGFIFCSPGYMDVLRFLARYFPEGRCPPVVLVALASASAPLSCSLREAEELARGLRTEAADVYPNVTEVCLPEVCLPRSSNSKKGWKLARTRVCAAAVKWMYEGMERSMDPVLENGPFLQCVRDRMQLLCNSKKRPYFTYMDYCMQVYRCYWGLWGGQLRDADLGEIRVLAVGAGKGHRQTHNLSTMKEPRHAHVASEGRKAGDLQIKSTGDDAGSTRRLGAENVVLANAKGANCHAEQNREGNEVESSDDSLFWEPSEGDAEDETLSTVYVMNKAEGRREGEETVAGMKGKECVGEEVGVPKGMPLNKGKERMSETMAFEEEAGSSFLLLGQPEVELETVGSSLVGVGDRGLKELGEGQCLAGLSRGLHSGDVPKRSPRDLELQEGQAEAEQTKRKNMESKVFETVWQWCERSVSSLSALSDIAHFPASTIESAGGTGPFAYASHNPPSTPALDKTFSSFARWLEERGISGGEAKSMQSLKTTTAAAIESQWHKLDQSTHASSSPPIAYVQCATASSYVVGDRTPHKVSICVCLEDGTESSLTLVPPCSVGDICALMQRRFAVAGGDEGMEGTLYAYARDRELPSGARFLGRAWELSPLEDLERLQATWSHQGLRPRLVYTQRRHASIPDYGATRGVVMIDVGWFLSASHTLKKALVAELSLSAIEGDRSVPLAELPGLAGRILLRESCHRHSGSSSPVYPSASVDTILNCFLAANPFQNTV